MSRTKIRRWLFRDPLLRKSHAHAVTNKEPDLDEELDLALEELEHQHEWAHLLDEEERNDG